MKHSRRISHNRPSVCNIFGIDDALFALGASALISGISQGVAGAKNKNARKTTSEAYKSADLQLATDEYRNPLTSISGRATTKRLESAVRDNNQAVANRAEASGSTVENELAAKDTSNRVISDTYSRLLEGEDKRRQSIRNQRLNLQMGEAQQQAAALREDASNWQSWGSSLSNALTSYGTASLLGGGSLLGGTKAAATGTPVANKTPILNAGQTNTDLTGLFPIGAPSPIYPQSV